VGKVGESRARFRRGHKKLGGRKKGTPNKVSQPVIGPGDTRLSMKKLVQKLTLGDPKFLKWVQSAVDNGKLGNPPKGERGWLPTPVFLEMLRYGLIVPRPSPAAPPAPTPRTADDLEIITEDADPDGFSAVRRA